jgi:hypothetical protein
VFMLFFPENGIDTPPVAVPAAATQSV